VSLCGVTCGRIVALTPARNGYSQHGDYVFGWKGDSLQRALDARCTGDACAQLKVQSTESAVGCTIPARVKEEVNECKSIL
jgi:hypothetical protein